jgi:chemotaxis protein methyltransferase CheR
MTAPAPDDTLDAVRAAVRDRTGIVLGPSRRADLKASLRKVMTAAGADDPGHWAEILKADAALFDQVIADITIGETYFFREPEHFAFVRNDILPGVRRRKPGQDVQVWSAGCATGEEPYSLAILFDEAGQRARILATDISRPSLAKAKPGVYGRWSLRGDGARLIGSYLRPVPAERQESYQLIERLRDTVQFTYLNLGLDFDPALVRPGSMDLIFCRNVLIYLDDKTIAGVTRRFYDALADGGVLITGPSDPVLADPLCGDSAPFITEATPGGLIYRKNPQSGHARPLPAAVPDVSEPIEYVASELEPAIAAEDIGVPPAAPRADAARTAALGQLRGLADGGNMSKALAFAATAAAAHPASADIAFLQSVLLMNFGRFADAEIILKRMVYLDPTLAVAHFALGNLRARTGDSNGALRAFRAAHQTAAARPPAEVPALSEGDTAGQIAAAAASHAERLTATAALTNPPLTSPASAARRASR